jgi:hypothetical protein
MIILVLRIGRMNLDLSQLQDTVIIRLLAFEYRTPLHLTLFDIGVVLNDSLDPYMAS